MGETIMRFRLSAIGLFAALAGGALLLDGCGGGGAAPSNAINIPQGTKLTLANSSNVTQDAIILAERASTEPFLSAYDAARIDADLALIRRSNPQMSGIHAHPNYV